LNNKETDEKQNGSSHEAITIIVGIFLLAAIFAVGVSIPVSYDATIECDSGEVGINFDASYENTKIIDNETQKGFYYTNDMMPKNLSLHGIKNIRCTAKVAGKAPLAFIKIFS